VVRTRFAATLALAALVAGSLGGCFLLPSNQNAPTRDRGAIGAVEGDCWATNVDDLIEWSTWQGDDPVECNRDHQSYTFFVGELEARIDDAWDGVSMSDELVGAVSELCLPKLDELLGTTDAARIELFFFATSPTEWEAGERVVRCDLALLAAGSDYFAPDIATLPTDIDQLLDDVRNEPRRYQLCLTGDGYGPHDSREARYADCTDDYDWRFGGTVEYPASLDAEYPAEETLLEFADDECAALGAEGDETVLPYLPFPDDWQYGDRSIECWFSLVSAPQTLV